MPALLSRYKAILQTLKTSTPLLYYMHVVFVGGASLVLMLTLLHSL